MPFPTTFYNMRYFVPLFPLAALVLVRGWALATPALRRGLLIAHGIIGAALILVFNLEPMQRFAEPAIPELEVNWIGVPLSLLDNLRLRLHLEQKDLLEHVDRQVPPGATLYLIDFGYYRDAQHGVYEQAALIRPDITTRYVGSRDFQPDGGSFYVWSYAPRRPELERWGRVVDLGRFLYRVESPDEAAPAPDR